MIHGRKVIGIIGGMGPMATADLFIKIIESTDAKTDQEHLHVLIDNNTDIPDRTACILDSWWRAPSAWSRRGRTC